MQNILARASGRMRVLLVVAVISSLASLMLFAGPGEAHGNYCRHGTYNFSQYSRLKFASHYSTHLGHVHKYRHQHVGHLGWYTDHYDRHNC